MATTLKEKLNVLSPETRKKVEARTAELIIEEMNRRKSRQTNKWTPSKDRR